MNVGGSPPPPKGGAGPGGAEKAAAGAQRMARRLPRGAIVGALLFGAGLSYFWRLKSRHPSELPPRAGFTRGLGLGYAYNRAGRLFREVVPAETAHKLAVKAASLPHFMRNWMGLTTARPADADENLNVFIWDKLFPNPVGLAAGFDKDGEAIDGLLDMGFGFVEIGTVTPEPQPGNPQPRVFRLEQDRAIINSYGFNSVGIKGVLDNLTRREQSPSKAPGIVGINIGKNKESPDAIADYVRGVKELGNKADYLVINVSSPNTPGLRALQSKEQLEKLVYAVQVARKDYCKKPVPILVKVSPDVSDQDIVEISELALEMDIDGLIVSNTTTRRPPTLKSEHKDKPGGLSGEPLFEPSYELLSRFFQLTRGRVPIIAAGGVSSGLEAYLKIRAGASLVQVYTSFAYDGPVKVAEIRSDLAKYVKAEGFNSVAQAVGIDVLGKGYQKRLYHEVLGDPDDPNPYRSVEPETK